MCSRAVRLLLIASFLVCTSCSTNEPAIHTGTAIDPPPTVTVDNADTQYRNLLLNVPDANGMYRNLQDGKFYVVIPDVKDEHAVRLEGFVPRVSAVGLRELTTKRDAVDRQVSSSPEARQVGSIGIDLQALCVRVGVTSGSREADLIKNLRAMTNVCVDSSAPAQTGG